MSDVLYYGSGIAYLVDEVIPPVGPRLLDAALLLDNSTSDGRSEDAERHRDTVVIVAVHTNAFPQLPDRFAINLQAIFQFLRFDPKLS